MLVRAMWVPLITIAIILILATLMMPRSFTNLWIYYDKVAHENIWKDLTNLSREKDAAIKTNEEKFVL